MQIAIVEQLHAVEEIFQSGDVDENSQFFYQISSSKYFLTNTNIASTIVFLVPGFGMRAISFATSTASGGQVVCSLNMESFMVDCDYMGHYYLQRKRVLQI